MVIVNTNLLRGSIVAQGMTQEQVAAQIGMDKSTFSRKMKNNALSFSIGEMLAIADVLKLSKQQASDIFLALNSQ